MNGLLRMDSEFWMAKSYENKRMAAGQCILSEVMVCNVGRAPGSTPELMSKKAALNIQR